MHRGERLIPSRVRDSRRPLAASDFTASRTTERLAPNSWSRSASFGNAASGLRSPRTIRLPSSSTTCAKRLRRRGAGGALRELARVVILSRIGGCRLSHPVDNPADLSYKMIKRNPAKGRGGPGMSRTAGGRARSGAAPAHERDRQALSRRRCASEVTFRGPARRGARAGRRERRRQVDADEDPGGRRSGG